MHLGSRFYWSLLVGLLLAAGGCKTVAPSNQRTWSPELALLPHAERRGDLVKVHNVRNCTWLSANDYVLKYYDKTYDLNTLESVDFIVSPFMEKPKLSHTMLSFGFGRGEHLGLSVEIRREQGEKYNPIAGFARQYELMYVLADERDLIQLSANQLHYPVYLYRAQTTPERMRALFVDVIERANKLQRQPEFYNTVTNNCTSNLVKHVNSIVPNRVPLSYKTIITGFSDEYAYDLGLIQRQGTFEQTREQALINEVAIQFAEAPDFSQRIRDPQARAEAIALRRSVNAQSGNLTR